MTELLNTEKDKDTAVNYSHHKLHCNETYFLVGKSLLKLFFTHPDVYQYMIKKQILNYNSDVCFCLGWKRL